MQNQAIFALTFTERADNQMWRLLLSRVAIEAGIGRENLRPLTGGNRSDLALVFSRTNGDADYSIEIVVINSVQHKAIVDASTSVGGLQRTRDPGGRQFGFY